MENTSVEAVPASVSAVQPVGRWSIKNLWTGRVTPYQYFLSNLFFGIIYYIGKTTGNYVYPNKVPLFLLLAVTLIVIPFMFVGLGLTIRRCHDMHRTGFLVFILFIPIVGLLFGLFLIFKSGDETENKYGLPPNKNRDFWSYVFNY